VAVPQLPLTSFKGVTKTCLYINIRNFLVQLSRVGARAPLPFPVGTRVVWRDPGGSRGPGRHGQPSLQPSSSRPSAPAPRQGGSACPLRHRLPRQIPASLTSGAGDFPETRPDPVLGCRRSLSGAGCSWGERDLPLHPASCPRQPCKCFPAAAATSHRFLHASRLGNEPLTEAVMRASSAACPASPPACGGRGAGASAWGARVVVASRRAGRLRGASQLGEVRRWPW